VGLKPTNQFRSLSIPTASKMLGMASAPAYFDPAFGAVLAGQQQIDLGARLGEREEARAEPPLRLGIPE